MPGLSWPVTGHGIHLCNGLLLLLQERSLEAEQLQREREQRAKQAAQAQGELARQATIIQQLQVQLRRAREFLSGGPMHHFRLPQHAGSHAACGPAC